jgi:hypothetical protein
MRRETDDDQIWYEMSPSREIWKIVVSHKLALDRKRVKYNNSCDMVLIFGSFLYWLFVIFFHRPFFFFDLVFYCIFFFFNLVFLSPLSLSLLFYLCFFSHVISNLLENKTFGDLQLRDVSQKMLMLPATLTVHYVDATQGCKSENVICDVYSWSLLVIPVAYSEMAGPFYYTRME